VTRIGIREDDESVRRVLTDASRMNGHEVVITRKGQEALRNIPTSAVVVGFSRAEKRPGPAKGDTDGRAVAAPASRYGRRLRAGRAVGRWP